MSVILLLRSNITKTSFSVHSLVFLMFQSLLFATHLRLDPLLATRHVYVRATEINAIYEIRYPPDSRDFSQHSAKKRKEKIANLRRTYTNHNLLLNRNRTKTNTLGEPYPLNLATVVAETGAKEMSVPFAAPSPLKL